MLWKSLKYLSIWNINIITNTYYIVLNSNSRHLVWYNNKTLVIYDNLIARIHNSKIFQDHIFELEEFDLDDNFRKIKYKVVWLIMDNRYLKRVATILPFKELVFKLEYDFMQ